MLTVINVHFIFVAMEHYYNILELSSAASEAEIRKAYRRLARKYHPDVNPAEDAEERFVEIAEAYEYLIEKPYAKPLTFEYQEPVVDEEHLRRERARQYARMRYDEFQRATSELHKAWYYKLLKALRFGVIYALYVAALVMLVSPVLAWFIYHSGVMVFGYCFLAIISSQVYVLARTIEKGTKVYFQS